MSLSLSVAATAFPTFVPAVLFSATVRVAEAPSSNVGSALLAPTTLLVTALAVSIGPSPSL